MIAYSYCRFSSKPQELGDSLRRQVEAYEKYCREHHLTPAHDTFHDKGVSGHSGANAKIGHLARFLKAIEEKQIEIPSVLVVESLDRLSRQEPMEAQHIFSQIIRAGITIVTLSDSQEYSSESIRRNPAQLFIITAIFMRAHDESETKSYRIKAKWEKAHKDARENLKPHHGKAPSWVSLKDGKYVLNSSAATVKRIISLLVDGYGALKVVQILENEKVPLVTKGKSKKWSVGTIQHLCYSKALIGEYQPAHGRTKNEKLGEPVKGYYPALISENTFYNLQNIMTLRKKGAKGRGANLVSNLFTGLMVDGAERNYVMTRKRDRKYLVSAAYQYNREGNYKTFPYEVFERNFLRWVTEIDLRQKAQPTGKAGALQARYDELQAKIVKAERAGEDAGDFDTLLVMIQNMKAKAKGLRAELEVAKAAEARTTVNTSDVLKFIDQMEKLAPEKRAEVRARLREKIAGVCQKIILFIGSKQGEINRFGLALVHLSDGSWRSFCLRAYRKGPVKLQDYSIGFDELYTSITRSGAEIQEFCDELAECDSLEATSDMWAELAFFTGGVRAKRKAS